MIAYRKPRKKEGAMNLTELLKALFETDLDGVSFSVDAKLSLEIRAFKFEKKVKPIVHQELGNYYHILLYKYAEDGSILDTDLFDAILTGPEVYISNIIKCGYLGLIVKKCKGKHSKQFVTKIYNNILNNMV